MNDTNCRTKELLTTETCQEAISQISVLGPLHTAQTAEFWRTILATHLGVDNLHVVRFIDRLLDQCFQFTSLALAKDGDLISHVQHMGHATDEEVDRGASSGRGSVWEYTSLRRSRILQVNAKSYWYHIMDQLHKFMVAVSRVTVNHDGRGGNAPDSHG